jgi:D-ribose pyranase
MKKRGILHQDISELVASMGHTDMLVIADAGLPIPDEVWRIDLALTKGVPPFLKTLEVILEELEVQEAILAEEIKTKSPELYQQIQTVLDGIPLSYVSHEDFKNMTFEAKGIVRTGEFTPYANVILVSGVTF